MKKITAFINEEQKDFLNKIIFEDAANSIGGEKGELGNSIQWCIDACMRIEKLYGIDACYVGNFDVREDEHNPDPHAAGLKRAMSIVYWNNARGMTQEEFTNWMHPKAKLSELKVE